MDVILLLVGIVVFLAVFTQSLSGFGVALVAMALLPELVGIKTATPLVALIALLLEIVLLTRYWKSIEFRQVLNISIAAILGTPIGVLFLGKVDERISLALLGLILVGYSLYALLGLKTPQLKYDKWAYLAGLLGGMLGGAYNTSGPPVIIYGDCRRWLPDVFKGNLQGYFVIVSLAVAVSHAISGNFTPQVWKLFWWSLPFLVVATIAGLSLDRWLSSDTYRRIVLVLLILMGLRLIF